MRKRALSGIVACLFAGVAFVAGQHDRSAAPVPSVETPLRPALLLLRDGKTEDARRELNRLLAADASNVEIHYQLARSYLMDFYAGSDPARGRTSLALAMEALENTLWRNPDHIPALKSKAVIHARAELLYYNPNLAYELGARIAKLQPSANEYLLGLTDWLSGEVRFTTESGHRVPHDPLTGLDRSIELLDRVIDSAMPYSNEEAMGLYQMGKTLSKRGNYREAVKYFERALGRPPAAPFTSEILREMGASLYRNGEYAAAARSFYRAVQAQSNPIDRWLLRVSLEQSKEGDVLLPAGMDFPVAEPAVDPANPPLLAFRDVAKEMGVNRFDGNGTCAFGDYDGDGKLDLLLAGSGTFLGLYRNDGSRFRDTTAEAGLANVPSGYSLNFVDYDNDGRLDIYLALNGWNGPMRNRLLRNVGSGKFKDVSKESGADDAGSGFVSLWGDLDNDAFLDLVVANGVLKDGSVPEIYRNKGDGTFANVTRQAGLNEPPTHGTIGAALGDYDRDGDLDLFLNGLQNSPNRLYRNDGKLRFTEVSKTAGVVQPRHMGYVAFFTDYNNDGWPDLLSTSLAPWDAVVQSLSRFFKVPEAGALHPDSVRLFRNNRDGTFTDATREAQLYYPMGVMGAGVADLDNDGHVDFYFGTGDPQLSRIEPNRFFRNNGNGTFSDLTRYAGLAQPGKKGHGVCFVDIDDDGDLDLYAQLGGHYPGDHAENAFYRNLKGNQNHWLQVELIGTKSNRNGIGAGVLLTSGEHKLYQEMKGSEGFGSTNPYRIHFGLGTRTRVDSLEILWPGGTKQTLTGVGVDRLLRVREETSGP
jgi:tetratricopeptide (TPR) repeat protein